MVRRRGRPIDQRGKRREQAAHFIGVSPTKFDDWVASGVMPKPKRRDGVVVWDVDELDVAFDGIDEGDLEKPDIKFDALSNTGNPWDDE